MVVPEHALSGLEGFEQERFGLIVSTQMTVEFRTIALGIYRGLVVTRAADDTAEPESQHGDWPGLASWPRARFWKWKKRKGDGLETTAPLFCAQSGQRLSKRRAQFLWREWQMRAGFDRLYPFHAIRHSAVTNVYRRTRDLFLAQRFARHASPLTTTVYTHPGDDEMRDKVRTLTC